jgi:hypothetical protein
MNPSELPMALPVYTGALGWIAETLISEPNP